MPRSQKKAQSKRKSVTSKKSKAGKNAKPRVSSKGANAAGANRAEGIRLVPDRRDGPASRTSSQFYGPYGTKTHLGCSEPKQVYPPRSFRPRWPRSNRGERTPNHPFPRLQ